MGQNGFKRGVVVVGGSAGSLEALKFFGDLQPDFPAAIFLVMHMAPTSPGFLPEIIKRYSQIPVAPAHDGNSTEPNCIYVARPDHHLRVRSGFMEVDRGPKENRHRPSIDVLFYSAAEVYGPRVVGVILSGMLDDGSAGLLAIRKRGGLGIVQEPGDALYPDMPRNALCYAGADYCVPHSQLAALLTRVTSEAIDPKASHPKPRREAQTDGVSMDQNQLDKSVGKTTDISCPDCGGVLSLVDDEKMLRFRCRVGHVFSQDTLFTAQSDGVEQALWTAVRLLEEKAETARKLREYSLSRNFKSAPEKFEAEAKKLDQHAKVIRELLQRTEGGESTE